MNSEQLIDKFGRHVNYVRFSVTDRCDLRCVYCMSEKMQFLPKAQLLTLEEIARLGKIFVGLGVSKIRITGGEPLLRRNILQLFQSLSRLNGLHELVVTTNGSQLDKMAQPLQQAGVKRVNISLDTLRAERFSHITRTGSLEKTLAGIDAAVAAGFDKVKINAVILKHRNHDEIIDLVQFAVDKGIDISFIEEMPMGDIGSHDRFETYYGNDEILRDIQPHFNVVATTTNTGGPSRYYKIANTNSKIGFISPHSHNFCSTCNRVRMTPEGRLLLCLGQEHSVDLRRVLRAYPNDDEPIKRAIISAMQIKPQGHEFDLRAQPVIVRHMNVTGG